MKKALLCVAIAAIVLVVLPVVASAIGEAAVDVLTTVYAVAIIVFPLVMVYFLVKHLRKRKEKKAEKPAAAPQAQPAQAPRPVVTITKSDAVPQWQPEPPEDSSEDMAAHGIAYHYTNVGIFVPFLDVLDRPDVVPGAVLTFRQEPENKYDSRAVAVVIGRKRIGYLYRGKRQDMANDWLERGDSISGRIVRVSPEVIDPKKNAIAIDIYFYE